MNEESKPEALSALMDDELPAARRSRLLDSADSDSSLRERWDRYHLIGAVIRGEGPADQSLSADLTSQIDAEPVALPGRRRPRTRPGVRPLTGLAIAASVAALSVVALRMFLEAPAVGPSSVAVSSGPPAPAVQASAASSTGAGGALAGRKGLRVADSATFAQPSAAAGVGTASKLRIVSARDDGTDHDVTSRSELRPDVEVRLNHYLVNHTESLPNGMRGMFPYAALVGYEPAR